MGVSLEKGGDGRMRFALRSSQVRTRRALDILVRVIAAGTRPDGGAAGTSGGAYDQPTPRSARLIAIPTRRPKPGLPRDARKRSAEARRLFKRL